MKTLLKLTVAVLGMGAASTSVQAQTNGTVTLTATLGDLTTKSSTKHWTVVWVTNKSGEIVRTLRRQGPNYSKHWNKHCSKWYSAVDGKTINYSVAEDGFTSATAATYDAPHSPFSQTWNCKDANGNTVPDGTYKFWIQYAEDAGQGPVTTDGLTWTKGPSASTARPPDQDHNFTNLSIVWTPVPAAPKP